MRLDRAFQRRVLEACAEYYPSSVSIDAWNELSSRLDENTYAANLTYLHQHGLMDQAIWVGHSGEPGDFTFNPGLLRCTQAGMDFLAEDGGLGAILGTVTIKIHEETIQQLIQGRIAESDLQPAEKKRLLEGLKELSSEATKHLTMKLIDQGLARLPEAIALIDKLLP